MSTHFSHIQSLLGSESSIQAFLESNNLVLGDTDDYDHYRIQPFVGMSCNMYKFNIKNNHEWFINILFPSFSKSEIKQFMSATTLLCQLFPVELFGKKKLTDQFDEDAECSIISNNHCILFSNSIFKFILTGTKTRLSFQKVQIMDITLLSDNFVTIYNKLLRKIDDCFNHIKENGHLVTTNTVLTLVDNQRHDTLPSSNIFLKQHRDSELYDLLLANKNGVSFFRYYFHGEETDIDTIFSEHHENSHHFLVSDFKLMKKIIDLCLHVKYARKVYQLVCMARFTSILLGPKTNSKFSVWHPKQNDIKKSDVIRNPRLFKIYIGNYVFEFNESIHYNSRFLMSDGKSGIDFDRIDDCYDLIIDETRNMLIEKLCIPDNSFCNEHIAILKMMDF